MKFILNASFLGKCLPVIILIGVLGVNLQGQIKVDPNKSVGVGVQPNETVHPSANFEVRALSPKLGGLLIPQVNNQQMNSIPTPQHGLIVYNTEQQKVCYYAQSWVCLDGANANGNQSINRSGPNGENVGLSNGGVLTNALVPIIGTNGHVLTKTATGYGWQTAQGSNYTQGTGISINNNVITNTQPESTSVLSTSTINMNLNNGQITSNVNNGSIGPVQLASTSVTSGSYTNANITVDADGRITAASSGSGGGLPAGQANQTLAYNNNQWLANSIITNDGTNVGIGIAPDANSRLRVVGRIEPSFPNSTTRSIAIGKNAGNNAMSNDSHFNICLGENSGKSITTGNFNCLVGAQTGENLTTGSSNTFVGYGAGQTGAINSNGVAIGTQSRSGNKGVSIGHGATTSNDETVMIGYGADGSGISIGYEATTLPASSIAIGYEAKALGASNTIAIGHNTTVGSPGIQNCTVIGNNTTYGVNNSIFMNCGSSTGTIGGNVQWSIISDENFKSDIKTDVPGLSFISKLNPVTYNFEYKKFQEYLYKNVPDSLKSKYFESIKDQNFDNKQTGFIAQEVEKICKELNYEFDALHIPDPNNNTDHYSLAYSQFVVPLVKAVQEQQVMIEDLKKDAESKNAIIEDLIRRLEKLEGK